MRRTGATAIAQSGRADAVQLGMSITGHKSVPMFEKYVQKNYAGPVSWVSNSKHWL
jgi:hypothetical protein